MAAVRQEPEIRHLPMDSKFITGHLFTSGHSRESNDREVCTQMDLPLLVGMALYPPLKLIFYMTQDFIQ